MSSVEFEDNCPGCKPVLIDPTTGKRFPDNSTEMQAVNTWWKTTTLEQREAFHRICCQNSRAPRDMQLAQEMSEQMKASLDEALKKEAN